ncbi:MAG TPA: hypothetical protein VIG97_10885 [Luteimonas sp.]
MHAHRSRSLRAGRWSEPGRIYHLTLVTRERQPWFGEWEAASSVSRARATRAWRPADGGGPWQPGFHDRALRAEEDLLAVARYVVANPIRAGLCRGFGAWPYWDAVWIDRNADPAA